MDCMQYRSGPLPGVKVVGVMAGMPLKRFDGIGGKCGGWFLSVDKS